MVVRAVSNELWEEVLEGMTACNVSEIMKRVRSAETTPEIIFRKALWAKGYRYRLHSNKLPGKPDIILMSQRVAIFIDGDFWHGGQWRRRKLLSLNEQFSKTSSKDYWLKKSDQTCVVIANGLFHCYKMAGLFYAFGKAR